MRTVRRAALLALLALGCAHGQRAAPARADDGSGGGLLVRNAQSAWERMTLAMDAPDSPGCSLGVDCYAKALTLTGTLTGVAATFSGQVTALRFSATAAAASNGFACATAGCRFLTTTGCYITDDTFGTMNIVCPGGISTANNFTTTATLSGGTVTVQSGGSYNFSAECDSRASPGNATCNQGAGLAAIANGASTVTITNSLVTTATLCDASLQEADGTVTVANCVCSSGSMVINLTAVTTADRDISWRIWK